MVKLRVKSCFQQVPPTKLPYVMLPSSDGQEPVYATAYDGTGNLNIFYVCKDTFTAIRIYRFYRSGPLMQWIREDTGFQLDGTRGQNPEAPNPLAYLGALYHKSRNFIYVCFALKFDIWFAAFPPHGSTDVKWVASPIPQPPYRPYVYNSTCIDLSLDRGTDGPRISVGFHAPWGSIDLMFHPFVTTWLPAIGSYSQSVSGPDHSLDVAVGLFSVAHGTYQDKSFDPTGQAVDGFYCYMETRMPNTAPASPFQVFRMADSTLSSQSLPETAKLAISHSLVSMQPVFLQDPTRMDVALAPLLVGIGRTYRVSTAAGNPSPQVTNAQEVVFLPNNQYVYNGYSMPAMTYTILFRDQLSHINFDDVDLGAVDNAIWVESAIEDLSGAGDGSVVKGTNWRAHVFAIFQNIADPTKFRLMHTQSFDPSGSGGSGVVELEPGIFDIPKGNWSVPVQVTADVLQFPFHLSMYGRSVCTLTVVDSAMRLATWTADLGGANGVITWTCCVVSPMDAMPYPAGSSVPNIAFQPEFYMELGAMNEDDDGELCSPIPFTKSRVGSDTSMDLFVNGIGVHLTGGGAPVEVSFNAAGMLGISIPLGVLGSTKIALESYPTAIPNSFWINVDDMDSGDLNNPVLIDLLPTPSTFFSTFRTSFGSDSLLHARTYAPPSGIEDLGNYFDDPSSTPAIVSGLQALAGVLSTSSGSSSLEQIYLTKATRGQPNVGVRLKSDPCSIAPATQSPSLVFRIDFDTNIYRATAKSIAPVLKTSYGSSPVEPVVSPSGVGWASATSVLSLADVFRHVVAETGGYIKSLAVDCSGSSALANVSWAHYDPHSASDTSILWAGKLKSAGDVGMLFSIALSYAGLYGGTVASWLDESPPWMANVQATAQKMAGSFGGLTANLTNLSASVIPVLTRDFLESIYKSLTDTFNQTSSLYMAYNAGYDYKSLAPHKATLAPVLACQVSYRVPGATSWLYNHFFDVRPSIPSLPGLTPAMASELTGLLHAVHTDLDDLGNAGLLDDLITFYNECTSSDVFFNSGGSTSLPTMLPFTTKGLINAVGDGVTFAPLVATLLEALLAAGDGVLKLSDGVEDPTMAYLYQVLSAAPGSKAPSTTTANLLSLVLGVAVQALDFLLRDETLPPTDQPFYDMGLVSLASAYYCLTDYVPSVSLGNLARPALALTANAVMADIISKGQDPIITPWLINCLQAGAAVSCLQLWLDGTQDASVIVPEEREYIMSYLTGLASYGHLTTSVYAIKNLGQDLENSLDSDRLPQGFALWKAVSGLGALVQLAVFLDKNNRSRLSSRFTLSVDPDIVGLYSNYTAAACGFRASQSRNASKPKALDDNVFNT